jgi:hypothetical protein
MYYVVFDYDYEICLGLLFIGVKPNKKKDKKMIFFLLENDF